MSRTKSQHSASTRGVFESSLSPRSGSSRLVNFSSFRISQKSTPNPVRRNTTRAGRQISQPAGDNHARSYQNIRQLSVDPNLLSHTNQGLLSSLQLIQRSAPQTPLIDNNRTNTRSTTPNIAITPTNHRSLSPMNKTPSVSPRSISPNDIPLTNCSDSSFNYNMVLKNNIRSVSMNFNNPTTLGDIPQENR